jgi:hypothetical protein
MNWPQYFVEIALILGLYYGILRRTPAYLNLSRGKQFLVYGVAILIIILVVEGLWPADVVPEPA